MSREVGFGRPMTDLKPFFKPVATGSMCRVPPESPGMRYSQLTTQQPELEGKPTTEKPGAEVAELVPVPASVPDADAPRPVLLRRIARGIGLDSAVAVSLLNRVCSGALAPLSIVFVTSGLTSEEQGFYYTFAGVSGLSMFIELGIGVVLSQFFSTEYAKLTWTPDGTLTGSAEAKGRLASLFRQAIYWYAGVAALTVPLLLVAGGLVFGGAEGGVAWWGPWILLVVFVAAQYLPAPLLNLQASCGRMSAIARLSFYHLLAGTLALWCGLLAGAGLYAVALPPLATLAITAVWFLPRTRPAIRDLWTVRGVPTVSWRRECLPLQWRVAITWLSAYLGYHALTPIVFAYLGPIPAGKFGLSMSLSYSLYALGFTWLQVRQPTFVTLAAGGRVAELDREFFRTTASATALVALTGGGLTIAIGILGITGSRYADRFLSPWFFGCLALFAISNTLIFAFAAFARSFLRESMFFVNLMTGLGLCGCCWLVCQTSGEMALLTVSLLTTNFLLGVCGSLLVYRQIRRTLVPGRP